MLEQFYVSVMMNEMQSNHSDKNNHSLIFFLSKKSSGNMIFISFATFSLCQQTVYEVTVQCVLYNFSFSGIFIYPLKIVCQRIIKVYTF